MTTEYAEDITQVNEHYDVNDRDLHVIGESGDVEVWLNMKTADFEGVSIGGGESHHAAVEDAVKTLERALEVLRGRLNG